MEKAEGKNNRHHTVDPFLILIHGEEEARGPFMYRLAFLKFGSGAGVRGNEDNTPDDALVGQQAVRLVGQIERQHLVHDRLQFPLGSHRQHLGQVLPADQRSGHA